MVKAAPSAGAKQRCLTPRSSRAPTAGRQARPQGTVYIVLWPGLASHRRCRLNSNVRPHITSVKDTPAMNTSRSLPLIVELDLCLPPRSDRAPLDGKQLSARCQRETGLSSDVVLGLNFVPDEQDVEQLKRTHETEEVKPEDFQSFCLTRGLRPNPEDTRTAGEFLAFARGQRLAWPHLPAERPGLAMAKTIVRWAHENGLEVHDGASTYELLSDEQIYGRWQSAA